MSWLLLCSGLLLAFVNGANDNLKGVATLFGSGTLSYRQALALATASTALGSLLSVLLATALVEAFSGNGVLPPEFLDTTFLASVTCAAAITVSAATTLGMPISTTHALLGGIVGAGAVSAGSAVDFGALASGFALPLLVSPFLAIALAYLLQHGGSKLGRRAGVGEVSCICLGASELSPVDGGVAAVRAMPLRVSRDKVVADARSCRVHGHTGLQVRQAISAGHLLSGSLLGFARGLNDTPKIVGLLAGASLLAPLSAAIAVGGCMAIGGIIAARRVTETLAKRLTPMTPAQGLAGNLTASLLVIGASNFGLPVSTTHVSVGGILGVGASTGGLQKRTSAEVLTAWLLTLPFSALLAASLAFALGGA